MDRRKQTARLALTGLLAAAALVLLLAASAIPSGKLAVCALAGVCVAITLVAGGYGAGLGCYLVSGLLALLLLPSKDVVVYYGVLGIYPLLKVWAEQRSPLVEWISKLVGANVLMVLGWQVFTRVLGLEWVIGSLSLPVLWLAANGVFVCYDLAFTRVMSYVQARLLPLLRRIKLGR